MIVKFFCIYSVFVKERACYFPGAFRAETPELLLFLSANSLILKLDETARMSGWAACSFFSDAATV